MAVFWVVAPCSLPEVCQRFRGPSPSSGLWNAGKLLSVYTALQPRRQPSSYSPPWEPQIVQVQVLVQECFSSSVLIGGLFDSYEDDRLIVWCFWRWSVDCMMLMKMIGWLYDSYEDDLEWWVPVATDMARGSHFVFQGRPTNSEFARGKPRPIQENRPRIEPGIFHKYRMLLQHQSAWFLHSCLIILHSGIWNA
jgi:hypothetical protein